MLSVNYVLNIMSLRGASQYIVKIVIVDNNSEYSEFQYLQEALCDIPLVEIIRLKSNVGYSSGLNRGLKYLYNYHCDYIVAGNNDLFFDRNFLLNLQNKQYGSDIYVIAPDIINMEGFHQNPQNVNSILWPKKFFHQMYNFNFCIATIMQFIYNIYKSFMRKKVKKNKVQSSYIILTIGACWVFTKEYLTKINFMEEIVFMWCEEVILSAQVYSLGGKIYYDTSLLVKHFENASVRRLPSRKKYHLYRESYWKAMLYLKRKQFYKRLQSR